MILNKFAFYTLMALSLVNAANAGVHPFHLSTAEMEMNAKSGRVEVALKIHGSDLERALTAINNGKRVSIGDDGKAHSLIESYLNQHFVLAAEVKMLRDHKHASSNDKPDESSRKTPDRVSTAEVVGSEFRNNWLWVYFELELPSSLAKQEPAGQQQSASPWKLRNTLLLDIVDSQINTISVRNKNGRSALRSSSRKPIVELPADWLDPANSIPRED
ncbi:MAG: hypothetical protein Aurels2KO_24870 [Aureliella sp.]